MVRRVLTLVAVLSMVAVGLFGYIGPARSAGTEYGTIDYCSWENGTQTLGGRSSAWSYDRNAGCSIVKVNLKFAHDPPCDTYVTYTGWYAHPDSIVVVGTRGSISCYGMHLMTSIITGATTGNYTYPMYP